MSKTYAFIKLVRPANVVIAGLSVMVGATVSGEIPLWWKTLLAFVSVGLMAAAGNAINDYLDLGIDRINKPQRPLPQGVILPREAFFLSIFLFLLGIASSIFINLPALMLSVFISSSLIIYSRYLKPRFLSGNLTVSLISSLAFVYGGITTEDFRLSLVPAVLSFFFHLGREMLKDLEDFKGDLAFKAKSLPITKGEKFTLAAVSAIFGLLVVLVFIPFMLDLFSVAYLIVAFFGVVLILSYVTCSMWKDSSVKNLGRLSIILKVSMCFGLLALLLGKL